MIVTRENLSIYTHFYVQGGRLPAVFHSNQNLYEGVLFDGMQNTFHAFYRKVSFDLRLTNAGSLTRHILSGQQSAPNIENTDSSNSSHKSRYYQHPERPKRHFSLGYKVFLSALVLVCGFYYATYAFRLGGSVKPETGAAYLLLGVGGIGLGIGRLFGYGFAILPP